MQESIKNEQELILNDYFCMMIRLFPDIIIQWNYSEARDVILVNTLADEGLDWYEDYCRISMEIENIIHKKYSASEAPLFEVNNKVFNINKWCETYYVVDRVVINME